MSSIYTIIFCVLLIGLRISCEELVQNRVERQDPGNDELAKIEKDFCKYRNPSVRVYGASRVDKKNAFLMLVLTIQKENEQNNPTKQLVFTTLYEDESEGPYSKFYSAKSFPEMRREIHERKVSVKFMFNAYNYKDYPFLKKEDKTDITWNINYIHFSDRRTHAYDITSRWLERSDETNLFLPNYIRFEISQNKTAYEWGEDKSGFVNLQLLYSHFPEEVEIIDIMIIHRTPKDDIPKYNALVYTSDRYQNNTYLYIRHYLKGTVKNFKSYKYDYWRIIWEFDSTKQYCDQLKKRVDAVSHIYEYEGENDFSTKFIEFYEFHHRILELRFTSFNSDTYTIIEDNEDSSQKLHLNSLLLNCKNYTYSVLQRETRLLKCIQKFHEEDPSGQDFIDPITIPVLPSTDTIWSQILNVQQTEESRTSWIKFFIFATIVTIVAIIGFGIYLLVTENKKTKNL